MPPAAKCRVLCMRQPQAQRGLVKVSQQWTPKLRHQVGGTPEVTDTMVWVLKIELEFWKVKWVIFLSYPRLQTKIHICYIILSTLKSGEINCRVPLAYLSHIFAPGCWYIFLPTRLGKMKRVALSGNLCSAVAYPERRHGACFKALQSLTSPKERLWWYFCQKKKKNPRNTSIPSIRAQKLFISLCSSGKRPGSWNSRHLKHFIVLQ